MSEVMNQAEELRQRMIALLVAERQAIDEKLALVGYDGGVQPAKKNKACSICGGADHNARSCDQRKAADVGPTQDALPLNSQKAATP